MSTTVYSSTADGFVECYHGTYSTARSGGGTFGVKASDDDIWVDQWKSGGGTYYLYCGYLDFDTSGIPDGDTVSSATLSLYATAMEGSPGALEVYIKDWGAEITSADWVAGDDVSALTKVATYSGSWATGAYRALTSEAGFPAQINKTGVTRLYLCTTLFRTGSAPTGEDGYAFYSANKGDGYKPKLVIEHAAAAGISIPLLNQLLLGD